MRALIVGVSTRAAAESAARAGFTVIALDAYGDLDHHPAVQALSLPRDFHTAFSPDAIVAAAHAIPSDIVVYLSSLENHPRAVEALAGGRMLWGNSPEVLRRVRNPGTLDDAFARRRIRAPQVLSHIEELSERGGSWLIKPRQSGGGHGVRMWHRGETITRHHYLQEFMDGVPGSVVFVAAGGRGVAIGTTRQLVGDSAFGATGFRYCGNILHAAIDKERARRAAALVDAVSAEFSLVGVGSIDVIATSDGLCPIEVNPRWSASMELVERARGVSVFGMHADACGHGVLSPFDLERAPATRDTHGKAIVFARRDVIVGNTRAWLDDADVRDVPREGERIDAGQPICTVLAAGADESACYAKLVERAQRIYSLVE